MAGTCGPAVAEAAGIRDERKRFEPRDSRSDAGRSPTKPGRGVVSSGIAAALTPLVQRIARESEAQPLRKQARAANRRERGKFA